MVSVYNNGLNNLGPGSRRVFVMKETKKYVSLFEPHGSKSARVTKLAYNSMSPREEEFDENRRMWWIDKCRDKYHKNANYRKIFAAFATEEEMSLQLMNEQTELLKEILNQLKLINGIDAEDDAPKPKAVFRKGEKMVMGEQNPAEKKVEMDFNEDDLTIKPKKKRKRRTKKEMEEARARGEA